MGDVYAAVGSRHLSCPIMMEHLGNICRKSCRSIWFPKTIILWHSFQHCPMERLTGKNYGKIKEETSVIRFSKAVTETEEKLLDIWKRMFGYENLGTEDNYFVLGGDSLIATKLISDIQKEFGCKIMISDIFENVTIKLLAQKIDLVRQNVIMEDIEMECGEI